ncbi:MAG TPA: c-type cytochrome biogenesis protein CcmI [Stellaceae bacterium]|jgi:cytochrome c-type biogenesis protein CcmH
MIWFLVVAGLLSMAVVAALLTPMIRSPRPGAAAAEEPVAALYRRQLAAIDEELAEGRLTLGQAETSRTEITRRLLAAADREAVEWGAAAAGRASEASWRFGAAVAVAGILPAAALAVYFTVGTPSPLNRSGASAAAVPHGSAELAAAADQIRAHLKEAPTDVKGWIMLGRTLASLGRFPEARDAYNHAIALSPAAANLHAELGEVLVLAAQGQVTAAAEAEFAKAPDDPRSRYYAADAALQRGDTAAAKQKLRALLAAAPPDAPWRQAVAQRLAELSVNGQPADAGAAAAAQSPSSQNGPSAQNPGPSAQSPGPSAQDIAAARSMSPEQRQAMIRGMVERLAERLERNPGDKAGWARLAHAYDVLGEPDKAQAARAREAAAGATTDPDNSQPAPARPEPASPR